MNEKSQLKISILLLIVTGLFGFTAVSQISSAHSNKAGYHTPPRDWKTYSNEQYGFSFRYPPEFSQQGKVSEVADLGGTLKAIEINFFDKRSNSELLVTYHFAPAGSGLFQYALNEYGSNKTAYENGSGELKIDGNNAIETITRIAVNGKGNPIDPPLRLVVVDVEDNEKTGEIQIQFRTPLPGANKRSANFQTLLSTFKLTGNPVH